MKTAYLDCFSGVAGDMFLGALLDLGADYELVRSGLDSMGLDYVQLRQKAVQKNGFRANQLQVIAPIETTHRGFSDIARMIRMSSIGQRAKDLAEAIFRRVAIAEAHVHGVSIEAVHFHEVGAIDSIADIVGTAIAWSSLGIEAAIASPIPTGTGKIHIAHGPVSLPAPATAELLKGIPIVATDVPFEMTTPTGAAIVAELASGFGPLPAMTIERIGYGAGTRDFADRPNLLRILVGQTTEEAHSHHDSVVVLETNLDDISAEQIGYAIDQLFASGALDVYTIPCGMKKNRPGTLLTVIARPHDQAQLTHVMFKETERLAFVRERRLDRSQSDTWLKYLHHGELFGGRSLVTLAGLGDSPLSLMIADRFRWTFN